MKQPQKQTTAASSSPPAATRSAKDGDKHAEPQGRGRLFIAALAILLPVLLGLGLSLHWSRQPAVVDIQDLLQQRLADTSGQPVAGTAFVATTMFVADTLLGKAGGFLHNDRLPPGLFMDNMPSWECGVMMALRDAVQALRNDFTRAQSQSREDLNVKRADLQFAIDPKSWMMPAAEDEYRKGIAALEAYFADLSAERTSSAERFFPRADNLAAYLSLVEKRLGNFGVRLSGSVADTGLTSIVESVQRPGSDRGFDRAETLRTPPGEVDNVFYCARGYSWALFHLMHAIAVDFAPVLAAKNAEVPVQVILRDLEGAIKPLRSPIVLNGHGYGLMANHSLVIASYISRVNAAMIDLKLLLAQG